MAVTNFWVELTENNWSLANNTSTVTAKVYISTTNSYNLLGTAHGAISFGGNASGSIKFSAKFGTNSSGKVLYSRTWTVKHNADGSGSVSVSVWFDTRVSAGTVRASKSLTLHKIARASTPKVSGKLELGQPITLNMNRASSAYTHTVRWAWAGQSGTIGTGIGASTTWTPQVGLAPYLTNAGNAKCTLTTTTYNGGTVIGTTTTSFTLSVPSTMVPKIDSVTVEDTQGYQAHYGAFLSGKSRIKVSTVASSVYGAEIASYKVVLGEYSGTGSTVTLPEIPVTANVAELTKLVITVTDTRGRTATTSKAVKVAHYSPNGANDVWAKRWDVDANEEHDESTTVRVHIEGTLFQIDGVGDTSGTLKIERKLHSESQFESVGMVDLATVYDSTVDVEGCDSAKVYDFQVTVTDSIGGAIVYSMIIPTATPIMDFKANGKGLSFFGVSRFDGLHFNGDVTLTNSNGTGAKMLGFSGGETPFPLLSTYPQAGAPDAPPYLRIGGDYYSDEYELDRIGALELYWSKYLAGDFGAPIWTGTWSSGSVTIPDTQKYRVFLIYPGNATSRDISPIIAFRDFNGQEADSGTVAGIGGYPSSTSNNSQNIYSFRANISGGTSWELVRCNYVTHAASNNHSAGATRPVFQVRGLF